jgi:hypothetical protein
MSDANLSIESRIAELERIVHALEHRVAAIERVPAGVAPDIVGAAAQELAGAAGGPAVVPGPVTASADTSLPQAGRSDLVSILSLLGRTCVVLGGAYLLRALTDAGTWPSGAGVAVGFAYAMVWLVAADRAGSSRRVLSATFFGAVATTIALPLLWEAVTRFGLIDGAAASVLLAAVILAVLAVSVRWRLHSLAWIGVLAGLTATLAFTAVTGAVVAFAVALIILGVATLWIGYMQDWILLRWPVAFLADVTVLVLATSTSANTLTYTPTVIIATALLLLIGYLASIVIRTLFRGREVVPFEIVQGSAALAVGFGGALYVAQATAFGRTTLVATGLVCGVACYAVAFTFIARRQGLRQNFYFYTSFGLVLVLAGTGLLLTGAPVLWAVLAVAAAGAVSRVQRVVLSLHVAVYVIAAAFASGLLAWAGTVWVGSVAAVTPPPGAAVLVLASLCACWGMPLKTGIRPWGWYARLPRLAIASAFTWAAAAGLAAVALGVLSGTGGVTDTGVVATVRTVALAATAIALAMAARFDRFREAGWLLYPVLLLGAVKLIVEDLPRSRPATLFIALAFYGVALIAAPRMASTQSATSGASRPTPPRLTEN